MSLDVSLESKGKHTCTCSTCGNEHESERPQELYSANITHNLAKMAREAGIYEALWRPEEIGITTAHQLIAPLRKALSDLKARPEHFEQFNSPNGWGMYEHFVPFVEKYFNACIQFPDAFVVASR